MLQDTHLETRIFPSVTPLGDHEPELVKDPEFEGATVAPAPQDSGRTRSSAKRVKQESANTNQNNSSVASSSSNNNLSTSQTSQAGPAGDRGQKRKRRGGDDSDSDDDNNQKDNSKAGEHKIVQQAPVEAARQQVCSCRNDVMKCIGILPSLPIVSQFMDNSSDTDSSLGEELSHTVLPRVSRARENAE